MFLSPKKVAFILANFADPDDMPRVVEFYLVPYCLPEY